MAVNRFTANRVYQRPQETRVRITVDSRNEVGHFIIACEPAQEVHPAITGTTESANREVLLDAVRDKLLEILRVGKEDIMPSPDPRTPGGAFQPGGRGFGVDPGRDQLSELIIERALNVLESSDEVSMNDLVPP